MKRLVMVGILFAVTGAPYAAPTIEHGVIEVAAWNLSGFNATPVEQRERQADVIARMDAEIIGLVEINPDQAVDTIIQRLSSHGLCYESKTVNQAARQDIAVLHKCGLSVGNAELIGGSDDGNPHLRKALAVDVNVGALRFKFVTVHMKAGRGRPAREVRDRQAEAIAKYVDKNVPANSAIVAGDYNMVPGQDTSNFYFLSPTGRFDFLSSNDLRETMSHLKAESPGSILDGYGISGRVKGRYVPGSLRMVPAHRLLELSYGKYRLTVSDHLPMSASFVVY